MQPTPLQRLLVGAMGTSPAAEGSGCILEVQTVDEEGWDDVEVVPVEMR